MYINIYTYFRGRHLLPIIPAPGRRKGQSVRVSKTIIQVVKQESYKSYSDAYKERLKAAPGLPRDVREYLERKAKIFDFLAVITLDEHLEIFNVGAFDDLIKGACMLAAERMSMSESDRRRLYLNLGAILPGEIAEQAQETNDRYKAAEERRRENDRSWSDLPTEPTK